MKIQLSEFNLTYVLGWYGTCDNDQEFDLTLISSSISSVLQIADDNHTWKSFEPDNNSSDFDRLIPGHIYYFTFNRGTNEVEIPDLVKTNYSDTPMSQQRITDQCGGNFSDDPDFGSDSGTTPVVTPSPLYGDTGQTPYTETPISILQMCCGEMQNSYELVSGQRFETPNGESFVSQFNGTLCFNNLSADMDGNMVLYYVSFDPFADEVHLEITLPTSNQITNIFSFTTDDGYCFTGTLDYMTPTLNRFSESVFSTPTPEFENPDFGSDNSDGDNYLPTPTPTPNSTDPSPGDIVTPNYTGSSTTPTPNYMETPTPDLVDYDYDYDYDDAEHSGADDVDTDHSGVEDENTSEDSDSGDDYIPPSIPVSDDVNPYNPEDTDNSEEDSFDDADPVDDIVAFYNDQVHQMYKERISSLTDSRSFSFDFQWTGDVPLESLNIVTIHVENNSISEIIAGGGVSINPTTTPREYYTMDMLFLYVENEIARNPDVANISYNQELGYITSFELDMSTNQEFDKVGFLVSNFNIGELNNTVYGDMQLTPNLDDLDDLGDTNDDQWDEESSYYEEGELLPNPEDDTTNTDTSNYADPISDIPEEMPSDSTESQGSDYDTAEMDDLEPDTVDDGYIDSVSDSVDQVDYMEGADVSELPMDEYDSASDIDYTDGVSDSVDQVDYMEGADVSELPMDGSALEDLATPTDGYLNPLSGDTDIFTAPEENPYEDLNTLE